MKWSATVLLGILSVTILVGCAETQTYATYRDEVNSWSMPQKFFFAWRDWFMDATDIVSFNVGAGETFGVRVMPTKLLDHGFIIGDTLEFGHHHRKTGFYRNERTEAGCSWMYYEKADRTPVVGTPDLIISERVRRDFSLRHNDWHHWADIGGEVGLIFVDVGVYVSPKEIVDFLATTVQLPFNLFLWPILERGNVNVPQVDISNDDTRAVVRRKYGVELVVPPPTFEPAEWISDYVQY